ncbi:nitronate monooxygenase [Paenibacillus sp. CC-CFT747]|nr:nitronate monooxygenase [Paenibacillus sp. CC-CFT747]
MGTATTVAEGAHLESEGIDLVVGQGSEAGGHRGTFLGGHEQALVGTMALIPQLADTLHVPVIAAGGIMDGRGIAASLLLGASGVQLGTAFLASPESGAHPRYKEAVLQSMEESTVVTRAFSGKAARGIRNRFVVEMEQAEAALPPYPVQNALTRELRREAARQERIEFMSLWAGQGSRLATDVPAGVRVRELAAQTEEAFRRMHF